MFDLFRSRAKAVRYLLGAILIVVAASMVVTLVPGFGGFGSADNDNVIAEIGGESLTTRDVQQTIQQQLRSKRFPREMAGTYAPMVVNEMIAVRAVAYEAERLGFQVTDAELAKTVQAMLPQLFQNGQYVGDQIYAQYLSRMDLTIPEFERDVRKQILVTKLQNIALEGEIVTDETVEEQFKKANEKIKIDYFSISPSEYRSRVKVTPAEIQQYFDQNKTTFRIGEKRDAKLLMVDQAQISKSIHISEETLRKLYRTSGDRFHTPERVKVRHILLKTTGKSPEEAKAAKVKAEDLLKQLKNGADFAKLAEKNSEDTGTAVEGGDLGWIAHGQTVPNFEKTAFSLKPGELSGVIETEYGYHIIQVMEKEKARRRPFDEVKNELTGEQKRQQVFDRMQQLADQARAELTKDPLQADAIARKLSITVFDISKVGVNDPIPEAAASRDLQDAIRSLPKGGVSQVFQVGDNRLGVAVVTKIYPERSAKLDEVKDQIRERLISQKSQKMAEEQSKKLEEAMKTAGNDLKKLARTVGAKIKSSKAFTRNGSIDGVGAAAYMMPAFDAKVGDIVGPINAMGRTVLCKVAAKIPADLTELAAQRQKYRDQIQQQRANQRADLFRDGIVANLIKKGKIKINERAIQRLAKRYTSS